MIAPMFMDPKHTSAYSLGHGGGGKRGFEVLPLNFSIIYLKLQSTQQQKLGILKTREYCYLSFVLTTSTQVPA